MLAHTSDSLVKKATQKSWSEWFALLDIRNAYEKTHEEITKMLCESGLQNNFWCEIIVKAYEQLKEGRENQKEGHGFQMAATNIYHVSLPQLFAAWLSDKQREVWYGDNFPVFSSVITNTYLHAPWIDGKSRLSISFAAKSLGKSQVTVTQFSLSSQEEAKLMKEFWKSKLDQLDKFLSK